MAAELTIDDATGSPATQRVDLARELPLSLGPIQIEPALRRIAHRDGEEEVLEPRVMQVLVALAKAPGRILTRDDLVERCWAGVIVGEDAITRVIGKLRRLSREIAADAFDIETITKVGYRLLLSPGAELPATSTPPVAAPPDDEPPPAFDPIRRDTGPLLAVLPFDNLSSDKELDFFSDGVSEEILQSLSRCAGLRLIARSSAFQCRGAGKATANVVRQLGVSHVLDGSTRRSGERLRISAQLVDGATGESLWAGRFDGRLDDVFALQDEIAGAVSQALQLVLLPSVSAPTMPIETYEVFLKAQAILSEGGRAYDHRISETIPLLESVVQAAPEHARAWELLAIAKAWRLRQSRPDTSFAAERASTLAAAETALRVDPGRGAAYEALAMLEPWGAYAERETKLLKGLEISPNEPGLLIAIGDLYMAVGRLKEAFAFAQLNCVHNPLFPAARLQMAEVHILLGEIDAGLRIERELWRRWPDNYTVFLTYLNHTATFGRWDAFDEARAEAGRWEADARAIRGLESTFRFAKALRTGDDALKREHLAQLRAYLARHGTVALNRITQMCVYGLDEEAMALAEAASFDHMFAVDGPFPVLLFPGVMFAPTMALRSDPRFVRLCERTGLCAYWRHTGRWPDCVDTVPYDLKGEAERLAALTA